ncbi:MAG: hypothetical protein JKY84_02580 [Emcibacteraceae bacterium]|nr:hypothetical protein [Emcibacteraceae bacterium]
MASVYYRGTNRDKATNKQIFALCQLLWADEDLHPAFNRVGEDGYFDMDEYIQIHNIVTEYWQALGGDVYLGDLFLAEAIVRKVASDKFPNIDSGKTTSFILKHRPHRHKDGSLMNSIPASVNEVLELIEDLREMIGVEELCEQSKVAFEGGDRAKIEELVAKENYLAERYRRKKGYMEKMGYNEAFTVLRDILCGEYKQELNSTRLKKRIEQGLQFWNY